MNEFFLGLGVFLLFLASMALLFRAALSLFWEGEGLERFNSRPRNDAEPSTATFKPPHRLRRVPVSHEDRPRKVQVEEALASERFARERICILPEGMHVVPAEEVAMQAQSELAKAVARGKKLEVALKILRSVLELAAAKVDAELACCLRSATEATDEILREE